MRLTTTTSTLALTLFGNGGFVHLKMNIGFDETGNEMKHLQEGF